MRNYFLVLVLAITVTIHSQTRGTKIGFIDMEYILQNVPNYTEANTQLEQKAQKWKQEIEIKKNEVNKLKESLKAEKALLTKNLIEERETEIKFLENEVLDLQQLRFGPNGNLTTQKNDLIKPIQDQVFTAIQDIAEQQKYDFIFDKTSDFTMIFAAKRYDISDLVLRIINRSNKREQLTKKQLQAEIEKEKKEDAVDVNPNLADRQRALEAKKAEREKILEERKLAAEQKKQEAEDRKARLMEEREAQKAGTSSVTTAKPNNTDKKDTAAEIEAKKQEQAAARAKILEERQQAVENRKKEAEAKRAQLLEEREAKKTGTISALTKTEEKKTTATATKSVVPAKEATAKEVTKQDTIDPKTKALEERKKIIEERKRELEEKRLKALQVRDSIKKAREIQLKNN
ncbi:OmpH family outer membrane protein [Flavobacterium sp. UMI-01]|uniref:OmpH family outer membrane protein n=1 Tax=Flavobacterium sp. UMI-01 TaxID=1441053 RepID=UPI001C7D5695|nr:OmpH family outer membrane protein [Flavobacterium sp. UMI-01]GIZ10366.1 membrane protein [Flavobacterium sp. UMI-01]